jgi:hypothetical protein
VLLKVKAFLLKYKLPLTSAISFIIPLIVYIVTLEKKLVGGDTTWFALQIPQMYVLVPTGYPVFSLLGKLISLVPVGDLAYRLNLLSAIFGALTILFLFLGINKLVKNEIISLITAMSFAFLKTYWSIASRLEFDTLNSFFIVLIIFSILHYRENTTRNRLYFTFFCLGLSLTNHPIAFFVMPAFLVYLIIINPRIFKSIKTILLSILFFLIPLVSYVYIPIRSLQGYGTVTTLKKFLYHVTGREATGKAFGGFYQRNSFADILKVVSEFFKIIFTNFGVILIIVAVAGFIYLVIKERKTSICFLFVIILNLAIITQYLSWSPQNYTINSMVIISFFVAYGFLLIKDSIILLINKIRSSFKFKANFKLAAMVLILILFATQPFFLAFTNFSFADYSKIEGIYLFWKDAFENIENNSYLYVFTGSANIGIFIDLFEKSEKNIEFIRNNSSQYSLNNMKDNLLRGENVYFIGCKPPALEVSSNFDLTQIGESYYWERYKESLKLFKLDYPKFYFDIEHRIDGNIKKFGEKFKLEYKIKNLLDKDVKITSLELELPERISLLGVDESGEINQSPGISQGKFMWVYDNLVVGSGSEINIVLNLRSVIIGKYPVKFRITTNYTYVESEDLILEIVE